MVSQLRPEHIQLSMFYPWYPHLPKSYHRGDPMIFFDKFGEVDLYFFYGFPWFSIHHADVHSPSQSYIPAAATTGWLPRASHAMWTLGNPIPLGLGLKNQVMAEVHWVNLRNRRIQTSYVGISWPKIFPVWKIPSGNLLHSYWKLPFIVDLPIKNGDFP